MLVINLNLHMLHLRRKATPLAFLLIFANPRHAPRYDSGASQNCSPARLCKSVDDHTKQEIKCTQHPGHFKIQHNTRALHFLKVTNYWNYLQRQTSNTPSFSLPSTHSRGEKLLTWRAKQPVVYIWISPSSWLLPVISRLTDNRCSKKRIQWPSGLWDSEGFDDHGFNPVGRAEGLKWACRVSEALK